MEIRLKAFKETLEQIEGAIKKRQSRDTANIGYKIQNDEKTYEKTHNIENEEDEQHGSYKNKQRVDACARER